MSANRLKLNADKTELIPAASTKYAVNSASMHVSRLYDLVQMSTCLSAWRGRLGLDRRVSDIFHRESAATLVHAFVTSRVDYV